MKTLFALLTLITSLTNSLASERTNLVEHQPDFTDVTYIVRVKDSGYHKARFQAIKPRWLYEKQFNEDLQIVGDTLSVVVAYNKPSPIPKNLKAGFLSLTTSSKKAEKAVQDGPFSGHQGVFAIFSSNRRIVALIYNWHGVLVTESARSINGSDTFQADGNWTSFQNNKKLLDELYMIAPKSERFLSPFDKWDRLAEQDAAPNP